MKIGEGPHALPHSVPSRIRICNAQNFVYHKLINKRVGIKNQQENSRQQNNENLRF